MNVKSILLVMAVLGLWIESPCFAANIDEPDEYLTSTVTDVTDQYLGIDPAPTPSAGEPQLPPLPGSSPGPQPTPHDGKPAPTPPPGKPGATPSPVTGTPGTIGGTIGEIISIGTRIWDFIVSSKPTADIKTVNASVVPNGITDWTQLTGWIKAPVVRIYHVEFKTLTGKTAGGFDYRISYLYGGALKGKGKFIGALSFVPANVKLHTDRSLTVRAELETPLNMGSTEDPVAMTKMEVTWSSPTTLTYGMNSAEYLIYGSGEIVDLTHGYANTK